MKALPGVISPGSTYVGKCGKVPLVSVVTTEDAQICYTSGVGYLQPMATVGMHAKL